MASRKAVEKWLGELTRLPTASGIEDAVVGWVRHWTRRRPDLRFALDSGGNVLITQKGRKRAAPVIAVAHMDHPAFVITETDHKEASFEFRGGVDAPYFTDAAVEVTSRPDGAKARVDSYDPDTQTGTLRITTTGAIEPGDIALWRFRKRKPPKGRLAAPACDDLAGCAAALAALDRARHTPALRHFGVLLTRAEEVGFLGALHAAKHRTVPDNARILSIETSRVLPDAPLGAGPIIRTGDRASVFDADLTNRLTNAARQAGLTHQRRLMDGGTCEATAFGAYGYQTTGLCLALGNWHNRGNLAEVEAGGGPATPALEEISLDDFHGLVDLLLLAIPAVDGDDPTRGRLDRLYESRRDLIV
ncbi:MAG: M20/M25/M40 family metallo-hydrolase [Acidimicrobiia bacterium]